MNQSVTCALRHQLNGANMERLEPNRAGTIMVTAGTVLVLEEKKLYYVGPTLSRLVEKLLLWTPSARR